jgi:hypothetical protein
MRYSESKIERQAESIYGDENLFRGPQFMSFPVVPKKDTFLLWDNVKCHACEPGPICCCDGIYYCFERLKTLKKIRLPIESTAKKNKILSDCFRTLTLQIASYEKQNNIYEELLLKQKRLIQKEKKSRDEVFLIIVQDLLKLGFNASSASAVVASSSSAAVASSFVSASASAPASSFCSNTTARSITIASASSSAAAVAAPHISSPMPLKKKNKKKKKK